MKKTKVALILVLICIVSIATVSFLYINNKHDKTEIIITTEQIDYQKILSKNDDKTEEEIINQLFKEEVLKKECEKRKIELDEETISKLKEDAQGELSDEKLNKIALSGMTEKEFRDVLFDRLVSMEKEFVLIDQLTEEIANNNVQVNNKEFKKKVDDINKIKKFENPAGFQDLVLRNYNLLEEYIEILKSDYVLILE